MESCNILRTDWRAAIILIFALGTLGGVVVLSPIPQDLAYHSFADSRSFLGIPNFFDVVSNIPFLVAGLLGIRTSLRSNLGSTLPAWLVLFVGIILVSSGSAFYHWAPDNSSLVWDRLPMTVGFMGLFIALLSEYFDSSLVRKLLVPAILLGAGTVAYWHFTDDLRFYAWIQFMPLCVIVLLLVLYNSRFTHSWLLVISLGWYLLAKVFEFYDVAIFQLSQETVSGHTIKHLFAAAGCYTLVVLLEQRQYRV